MKTDRKTSTTFDKRPRPLNARPWQKVGTDALTIIGSQAGRGWQLHDERTGALITGGESESCRCPRALSVLASIHESDPRPEAHVASDLPTGPLTTVGGSRRWLSWRLGAALVGAVVFGAFHFSEEQAFIKLAQRAVAQALNDETR